MDKTLVHKEHCYQGDVEWGNPGQCKYNAPDCPAKRVDCHHEEWYAYGTEITSSRATIEICCVTCGKYGHIEENAILDTLYNYATFQEE